MKQGIHAFIREQIENYKKEIQLPGGWNWNMKDHLETTYLYAHSQLKTGKDDFKPVKNIIRPILNLQHRTEDIEVKDVEIYVNDPDNYHLSFLVKKYHDDVFVVENDLDTFFDELNVSRIDYGAGLSKHLDRPCPENVPLHSIAFCDQTNILSGPIGLEHWYSPDQLLEMRDFGWGNPERGANISVEHVIMEAEEEKKLEELQSSKTPGKYVQIYEVHGMFPKSWITGSDADHNEYTRQLHIIPVVRGAKPKDKDDWKPYTLFSAEEPENPFKVVKRDPVYGRALGFGGAEELFESQVWTNYDMIRKQQMLDAAAVTILKTTDPNVAARNRIKDMDNLDIIELQEGADIGQIDTFPRNMRLFDQSMNDWQDHAQLMGAASDAILGDSPATNTPFKLQDLVVRQASGLHEYRRNQYARHLEEIYNDWIIPHIQRAITRGTRFLSELSLEEMQFVTDKIVTKMANEKLIEMVIDGKTPTQDEINTFKELVREDFKKKGNKHFIEILKNEFKGAPLKVRVSVRGKSKDLGQRVDNLVNVFRQIIANPAVLQIPAIAKIFNDIIEFSGLDPVDFTGITQAQLTSAGSMAQAPGVEQPLTQPGLSDQPQLAGAPSA